MNLYIYSDNSKRTWKKEMSIEYRYCSLSRSYILVPYQNYYFWDAEISFECEAKDILEADKAFEEKLGKSPIKMPYIGCEIFPLISDEDSESENTEMREHWTDKLYGF
jgi:hypothetical protein